jgi:hypothetical protein
MSTTICKLHYYWYDYFTILRQDIRRADEKTIYLFNTHFYSFADYVSSCTAKTTGLPVSQITLSPTGTTQTTPPASTTTAGPVTIADQGKIIINRQFFNFKRIDKWGDVSLVFQGVTFAPYVSKSTVTGPVIYWFTITFPDGATEDLQYLLYFNDAQNDGNISIETTKHDLPRAGVMLGHQNGRTVMYLLVSE